ncbi:hypothetical protein TIFTF001_038008 [Ficus carica]|uniref:Uncharacterized protein n=1 Tax=Ficus carica TaxID=3494 RepID=A0AA88E7A2_FICCA|nr:hypothetical protein TIFTF001_038008 [Ficus carica]
MVWDIASLQFRALLEGGSELGAELGDRDGEVTDGKEGGNVATIVHDIHKAVDGAAWDGAAADRHGNYAEAPAR